MPNAAGFLLHFLFPIIFNVGIHSSTFNALSGAVPRCGDILSVAIYPDDVTSLGISNVTSTGFQSLQKIVRSTFYYTPNVADACLLLLAFDTLDRDELSPNYFRNLDKGIGYLDKNQWNNGQKHIIFNQFSGTYPYYVETALGFNAGEAILAKSSFSERNYRKGFDIAFPLFHWDDTHIFEQPFSAEKCGGTREDGFREFLLVFKGKRYVYGLGSQTRDKLFHLHDSDRTVILTTCKHGKDWERLQDERCESDNFAYERFPWEYREMLANSAFCLIPRGRRLDSYRFLEALSVGCVPVILSDSWLLPFSEVIDWDRIVLRVPEGRTFQIAHLVRSISWEEWRERSDLACRTYRNYFASAERIMLSTFLILNQRYASNGEVTARHASAWMDEPLGALAIDPGYKGVLPTDRCPDDVQQECLVVTLSSTTSGADGKIGGKLAKCKTMTVGEAGADALSIGQQIARHDNSPMVILVGNGLVIRQDLSDTLIKLANAWRQGCLSLHVATAHAEAAQEGAAQAVDLENSIVVLHRYIIHHLLSRGRRDVLAAMSTAPPECVASFAKEHAARWFRTGPKVVRVHGGIMEMEGKGNVRSGCGKMAEEAFAG